MKAYVFITVAAGKSPDVVQQLRRRGGVRSADICWGLPDIVALIEAADSKALQELYTSVVDRLCGPCGSHQVAMSAAGRLPERGSEMPACFSTGWH